MGGSHHPLQPYKKPLPCSIKLAGPGQILMKMQGTKWWNIFKKWFYVIFQTLVNGWVGPLWVEIYSICLFPWLIYHPTKLGRITQKDPCCVKEINKLAACVGNSIATPTERYHLPPWGGTNLRLRMNNCWIIWWIFTVFLTTDQGVNSLRVLL